MQEYKHSFIYARVVSLHRDMCVRQSKQGDSKTGNKSAFSSSVKQWLGAMIHLIIAGSIIISNVSMYRVFAPLRSMVLFLSMDVRLQ